MARLIIVAGASGAGKSFLLNNLNRFVSEIMPIKKLTTRNARVSEPPNESLDLIFSCSDQEIQNCDYTYHYCGHNYGIKKEDINRILSQRKSPIVIVANCDTICEIKNDYKEALVIYVQNILSGKDLEKQLIKLRDPIDVKERMKRQKYSLNDYIHHFENNLFDYVLINDFSEQFMFQVQSLIKKEISNGIDSNYVFVIMSFKEKYNDVYRSLKIASQLSTFNNSITLERVDENKGGYIITDKIKSSIENAGLIICDISEDSPNVFFEFGYAIAKNKTIILVAKKGRKLPFDISQYKTIFYSSEIELQDKIKEELENHYKLYKL